MVDILTELQRGDADDALRIRVYSDGALRSVLFQYIVVCTRIQILNRPNCCKRCHVMKFTLYELLLYELGLR